MATVGVTEEEIISYDVAHYLPMGMTVAVIAASVLQAGAFLLYNYKVISYLNNKDFY